MPQVINTNIASLNAQRNLNNAQNANGTALQRLSSGLRINSAKDDAAGLAISTRFDAQIKGNAVAIRNAGDGISLAQTAEGALNSITSNLQRVRELALQSANDTNTDLDRQALNAEVQQLVAEIDNTSQKASFNGRKLLDGSFTGSTFQTGANLGDTISFGITKTTVDSLGSAKTNGVSTDQLGAGGQALKAGDLVINGFAVGASQASSDSASTDAAANSAIAKAAAVNAISDQSGVTATANANTLGGTAIGAAGADVTGVTINGASLNLTALNADSAEGRLKEVVDAVNAVSGQTGVRAEMPADADSGVTLIADDGRNIQIGGANAGNAGLQAANTYTGTITLSSDNGQDINVTSTTGDVKANVGISVGTYSGTNSGVVSEATSAAGATSLSVMTDGDLVINGVAIGGSLAKDDTASTTSADGSAIAKAAAINRASSSTGVTAEVGETRVNSNTVTAGASNFAINGTSIDVAAASDAGGQVTAIVDAVNAKSGQTGVRAEALGGDKYTLVAEDGRNINISGAALPNVTAGTTAASVTLKGAGDINISTNTANVANTGFAVGTYGGGESGQLLKDVDISTVEGANKALKAVDNALQTVSSNAADLGAIQKRFESTISNLQVTRENLSAANSRIKDADFAAETAELSRTQVLQQAGTSILAQANARPQQVLSLLQ